MPQSPKPGGPLKPWSLPWILTRGGYFPAEGAETYAQAVGGMIQSVAGGFGSSLPGDTNSTARKLSVLGAIAGIFIWNYYGGDPSQLAGLGKERFDAMNTKQAAELASKGKRPLFRRSSKQAIWSAVTGGLAWMSWAVGSGYAGPNENAVRKASLAAMVILSGACGWTMSHHFRKLVMKLDEPNPTPA